VDGGGEGDWQWPFALLRAACKALGLENMPESPSTTIGARAVSTVTFTVMMTAPGLISGLISRLIAETLTLASLAMAVLMPACVA